MTTPESNEPASSVSPEAPGAPSAEELMGQLLSLKAEFENYRKRVDRDRPQWELYGRVRLLERLLPLYDTLLGAHEQASRRDILKGREGDAFLVELFRGMELIFQEFTRLFEAEGIARIETLGVPYDAHRHEVLGHVESAERPEGTVVEEIQRGYTLSGKVLRPAKVRIAKAPTVSKA